MGYSSSRHVVLFNERRWFDFSDIHHNSRAVQAEHRSVPEPEVLSRWPKGTGTVSLLCCFMEQSVLLLLAFNDAAPACNILRDISSM